MMTIPYYFLLRRQYCSTHIFLACHATRKTREKFVMEVLSNCCNKNGNNNCSSKEWKVQCIPLWTHFTFCECVCACLLCWYLLFHDDDEDNLLLVSSLFKGESFLLHIFVYFIYCWRTRRRSWWYITRVIIEDVF